MSFMAVTRPLRRTLFLERGEAARVMSETAAQPAQNRFTRHEYEPTEIISYGFFTPAIAL